MKNTINFRAILFNLPYLFWLLFYYFFFSLMFGGSTEAFTVFAFIYGIGILISLTPIAESLYRLRHGIRELRTMAEQERLLPIFHEVYGNALSVNPGLSKKIKLYIMDTMEINAFAVGRKTLVVTKGSLELLNPQGLYGLMAHEFGHFENYDTVSLLLSNIGNMTLTVFTNFLLGSINLIGKFSKNNDRNFLLGLIQKILIIIYNLIIFIGDVILMNTSRKAEYKADNFALRCGYGSELLYVLSEFDRLTISTPSKILEQLRSTHPSISKRVKRLERDMER